MRKYIYILILCTAASLCGCQAADVKDTANTIETEKSLKPKEEEKEFKEIEIIDGINEIQKKTIEEYNREPARVNMMDSYSEKLYLQQEDGTSKEETVDTFWLNNIIFSVPDNGSRSLGYPVFSTDYRSEREIETMAKWDAMRTSTGEDCPECNEGIEDARKWIVDGNLQKPIEEFLRNYSEICPEERDYTLYITSAVETYREEDDTSWWDVNYNLQTKTDNGEMVNIAYGEIYRVTLSNGEPVWYDDAHYRILNQNGSVWKLLEKPEEDRGKIWIDFIDETSEKGSFCSFYDVPEEEKEAWMQNYLEQYGANFLLPWGIEDTIHWEFERIEDFWYDYFVCIGETSDYEIRMEIPLIPEKDENWYLASRIRKEAQEKELCNHTLSVMRQTFHTIPYEYVVKEGDSLYKIAEKYYKNGNAYRRILIENEIEDPDLIYVGEVMTLTIR